MATNPAPRRITALESINKLNVEGEDILTALQQPASPTAPTGEGAETIRKESPAKWFIAADYKKNTSTESGDAWNDDGEHDYGSVRIPVNRIAMRDERGLIPASMLPSYIDDMMYGQMEITAQYAKFVEHVSGSTEMRTYVSPPTARIGHPEYLEPPENIVFVDISTDPATYGDTLLQYRFNKAAETNQSANYGFAEVPCSRAIQGGYGIKVDKSSPNILTISTKKPQYGTGYDNSVNRQFFNITSAHSKIIVDNFISSDGISMLNRQADDFTEFSGLRTAATYSFTLEMYAKPVSLTGNIIDVSLFDRSSTAEGLASVDQMDMSGPSGSCSTLKFSYMFTTSGEGDTAIRRFSIKAEESIQASIIRMQLVELI